MEEYQILRRSLERHIDNQELDALVPSSSETEHESPRLSSDVVREAARHLASCAECARKVSIYRELVNRLSSAATRETEPQQAGCPEAVDVDWREVAAGRWPERKARQLMMHAALCAQCGPLLRAAASAFDQPRPQEANSLPERKGSQRARSNPAFVWRPPFWHFMKWFVPAASLVVIVGMLGSKTRPSAAPLSGPKFAEFAVRTHQQHAQGKLALDIRSDSQQALNQWFRENSLFALTLPDPPAATGEQRPYHLEGARLVQVGGKNAAYIAYRFETAAFETTAASLLVTPDAVAVASGGVEAHFRKVKFHYAWVGPYKVVTWSQHGLTYALVSQEGSRSQRSCMVCHSAMGDRDLSQTPTPLPEPVMHPVLQ